jgi:hypothetical protein
MVAFLTQLLLGLRPRIFLLRQQLVLLQRRSPKAVRLWNIDRLLLLWSYRL